jgi:hypothetical protein
MFYHKLLEMTKPIILRSVSNCAFKTQLKRVSYVVSPTLSLKKNFVSDLEELKSVPVCTHVCICEQSHLKHTCPRLLRSVCEQQSAIVLIIWTVINALTFLL